MLWIVKLVHGPFSLRVRGPSMIGGRATSWELKNQKTVHDKHAEAQFIPAGLAKPVLQAHTSLPWF